MLHDFDNRKPFKFKQFSVFDDHSAMKVGTDAVLLGAWVNAAEKKNILDIGTGSGVIALMLAQKSGAKITGIDIHRPSIEDAKRNFSDSKWNNRLKAVHASFQEYIEKCSKHYDLIVSNPPFFTNSLKSPEQQKNISKHNDLLPYEELITGARRILAGNGSFCIIIPAGDYKRIIELSENAGLFLNRRLTVFPKPSKPLSRIIMEFSTSKHKTNNDGLFIRNDNNSYTSEYITLTKDFYLDF